MKSSARDRLAATLTDSVRAGRDAGDGRVDLGQLIATLADQRGHLGTLEGDRRAFRIMFVVGIAVARRCDDLVERVSQAGQALDGLAPLTVKPRCRIVHLITVTAAAGMRRACVRRGAPSVPICVLVESLRIKTRRIAPSIKGVNR